MVAPIPPMLKYSIVYNLLNFPPILIKFVSKFIVCKVLYFKVQYLLRMCYPLTKGEVAISKTESFSGRRIKGLGGIHMQSFDEIPLLVTEI